MDEPVVPRDTPEILGQSLTSEAGSTTMSDDPPKILSKSALKKAAKAERFAAVKLERRAKEKEAKKRKKRLIAEKRAAGEIDDEEEKNRHKKRPKIRFGGTVVVDLGFDDKMNEKEISSLCSQLGYTYSANRSAAYPFSLVYTSLNGRTFARLESLSDASYKRWTNTQWWHDGYERLWQDQGSITQGFTDRIVPGDSAPLSVLNSIQVPVTGLEEVRQRIIYLTADSEEELTELKPEETYIIGGICDHNRYKNLCLNKAKDSGVRTARLPIGRYLASLPTRKVLTVNQVFEILLKWVETRDWEEAFNSVIPKRKFHIGGKSRPEDTPDSGRNDAGVVEENELDEVDGEQAILTEAG